MDARTREAVQNASGKLVRAELKRKIEKASAAASAGRVKRSI